MGLPLCRFRKCAPACMGTAGGLPGPLLNTLTVPGDFASTVALTEYTLSAPPGTVLRAGARYWVVSEPLTDSNPVYLSTTSSPDEDQDPPPVDGWLIGDERFLKGNRNVWAMLTRVVKLAVLGSPERVTSEPASEDFPGAYFNGHETNGVVTPGTVSTGHLTAGVDTDHGLTGDYWYLDTEPGHSYRVEVKFGSSSGNNIGGSAGIEFLDPDGVDYASSCCESDHNRDDGHTFVHFTHSRQWREWNTRYLVHIAAYDQLNTDSAIYNGPYTITMTDIIGTDKVATNLYLGTRSDLPNVNATRQYAVSFTTGDHAVGYKLDRISAHIPDDYGSPRLALHANTSSDPGSKLCDFRNPSQVRHHIAWSIGHPVVPFLAPDCASQRLAASSTYWIVFAGSGYEPAVTDTDKQMTDGSGWTIGNVVPVQDNGLWSELRSDAVIPVEIWAKELQNPLSVSLEVTSDPTRGTDSDTYGAGDVITFEVKFTEAVTITGAPRLRFKISGAGDDYAPYVSGSGSDTLVFAYTVLATDADADGIFLYNSSLSYPDAAADTIVAVDDNLPVIDNITGQRRTLSGHKIDGTITN